MWLFPALVAFLGGCAGVHEVTGTASQDDLLQLRGEVVAAQQAAQRARTEAEAAATRAVDARMRGQTAEEQRQLEALNRRLDGLTTSLTELTTRVDDLASRLEALNRQQRGAAPAAPRTATPSTETPPATPVTLGHTLCSALDGALDGRTGDREARDAWTINRGAPRRPDRPLRHRPLAGRRRRRLK